MSKCYLISSFKSYAVDSKGTVILSITWLSGNSITICAIQIFNKILMLILISKYQSNSIKWKLNYKSYYITIIFIKL